MTSEADEYAVYVDHRRFGRQPNFTGLNPGPADEGDRGRFVECRKPQQSIALKRELYESLFHVQNKTIEQLIQMADACLSLIEAGIFTVRQAQRVRCLMNTVPKFEVSRVSKHCSKDWLPSKQRSRKSRDYNDVFQRPHRDHNPRQPPCHQNANKTQPTRTSRSG